MEEQSEDKWSDLARAFKSCEVMFVFVWFISMLLTSLAFRATTALLVAFEELTELDPRKPVVLGLPATMEASNAHTHAETKKLLLAAMASQLPTSLEF